MSKGFRGRVLRDTEFDRCFSKLKPNTDDQTCRGEKKRQQSRSAARSRRLTESEIFAQLMETLPVIDQPTIYQMDRIGALRLAVTLCRGRRVGERFFAFNNENMDNQCENALGFCKSKLGQAVIEEATKQNSMDACIEGFLMAVNKAGQLLYLTPGVAESIGFTQIDLVGRYLRDYVHADDWREFRDHLCSVGNGKKSDQQADTASKTFFRMKTALTPRGGRARKLTMAVYQAMVVQPTLFQPLQAFITKPSPMRKGASFGGFDFDEGGNMMAELDEDIRLIHCIPFILSSSRRSTTDSLSAITSRHDLDMRFRICDDVFAHTLGFKNAKSFIGRSYYDLIHPEDAPLVAREIRELYQKCHCRTGYYRLLNRAGEPIWVMTEMLLLVQNIRGVSQKSVVCAHQILSESENLTDRPRMIVHEQLKPVKEFDLEIDGFEYGSRFLGQDAKPKIDGLGHIQNTTSVGLAQSSQLISETPIIDRSAQGSPANMTVDMSPIDSVIGCTQMTDPGQTWQYNGKDHRESQDSEKLAPFIACDNETLTPLEDRDVPGLLPTYWDHWLCGNPIQSTEKVDCPKSFPDTVQPSNTDTSQNFSSDDILPLDFADIFGMNIEDTTQFSIDEAEHTFSQFESVQTQQSVEQFRSTLDTPGDPNWSASPDCTVPMVDDAISRKRSHSMHSAEHRIANKKLAVSSERRRRLDAKTVETFEIEMMGDQTVTGASDDFFGEEYLRRPRSHSFHYVSAAVEQQIESIQKELYRETQSFLA